ncbi:hypothetical protein BU24DRAFT_425251 [Aaosphaeria arxii CBS 175.79]|uniref:Saccharopine dehydrogenase-like C-terminal domain-containing protein n=1 Tax=Aaosphaeria arxii CBS 175.79 TaxID=1450172 RepID=A0A6A5XIG4_9PLEO|nr:uncharacterized protein BU24DRAFT_425251 [Aaosphaeria arxii CBS 175.79]KAF2012617.1 hypothetical protein BU24DRAFT_425251 [Aaosphaeria arxii CBS 175.79]
MDAAMPCYVMNRYDLVAYANRDSVPFPDFYNIPEARTVARGSLRYKRNPAFVVALGAQSRMAAVRQERAVA